MLLAPCFFSNGKCCKEERGCSPRRKGVRVRLWSTTFKVLALSQVDIGSVVEDAATVPADNGLEVSVVCVEEECLHAASAAVVSVVR
jgi:hypothetical protein